MANPSPEADTLSVRVQGRPMRVAANQTVLNALRRSGWPDLTGCGCRLGDCGECKIAIRRAGQPGPEAVLACVEPVQDGMEILEVPFRWTQAFRFAQGKG